MLRILVFILASTGLMSYAQAEEIEPRADYLAAFIMFGADYRNTGPDNSLTGHDWINTSRDPLTFYSKGEDQTMVIQAVDNCQYTVTTDTKRPLVGKPGSLLTEVDFNSLTKVDLYDGGLGSWVLRGEGLTSWCNIITTEAGNRIARCLEPFDGGDGKQIHLYRDLTGGADEKTIANVYKYFFRQICPRPQFDYSR